MKALRNLVLGAGLALCCAGCKDVTVVESTPQKLVVDINGENIRFSYDGKECTYSHRTPISHSKDTKGMYVSNEAYDVETTHAFVDLGCDNKIDETIVSIHLVPKKDLQEKFLENRVQREIYEAFGEYGLRDDVDPKIKEFREDCGLDKFMKEWDSKYKK